MCDVGSLDYCSQETPGNILQELHQGHPGIVRMKSIARSHVWWPKLDHDIESLSKSCEACQSVQSAPPVAPLHSWVWTARPWQCIHKDFAGPFKGHTFLIVVQVAEVIQTKTTTSLDTIHELHQLFSSYGLPEVLISDKEPQFTSEEFLKL